MEMSIVFLFHDKSIVVPAGLADIGRGRERILADALARTQSGRRRRCTLATGCGCPRC
jgi:hypothetical protein